MYRAAHLTIKQKGDEAPLHAAMRADELLDAGDMDGRAVWLGYCERSECCCEPSPGDVSYEC